MIPFNDYLRAGAAIVLCASLVSPPALADRSDDTVTVAAPWKIGVLTPAATGTVLQRMGVTEPLTRPDEDGTIVGLLAEDWTADETLTTWRFRIRPGVVFHDGTPLTAEVVARNLAAFADESALRRAPVESIESDGDAVVIRLSRPFAPLPAHLAHWSTGILSAAVLDDGDAVQPVGTGYYRVVGQDGSQSLSLEAFPDYWGERPSIGHARYVFAADDATRLAMVEAGEAELAFDLDAFAAAAAGSQVTVQSEETARIRALKLNVGQAPFDDLRVRQAISLAIDRDGIAAALLGNPGIAATQLMPAAVAGWYRPDLAPFAHDPAAARALLAEAGWSPGSGGVLERDGEPFSVELLTYDARQLREVATAVQAQLAEIGIEATIANVDWTAIPARHDDRTLEMAMVSDNFAYVPDPIGALAQNFTGGGGPWGALDWHDAEFEGLVEAYQATSDGADQAAQRARMMEIVHADLPLVTITWYDATYALSPEIDGFAFDPYEMRYGLNRVRWSD